MNNSLPYILGIFILFSFINTNAQVVDYLFPVDEQYATGYLDDNGKVDGDIDLTFPNVGWGVFTLSILPPDAVIQSIKFYGYILSTNYPKWSSTPMGTVDPIIDLPSDISVQILSSYDSSTAYVYLDEWSSYELGWHEYDLGDDAAADMQAALNSNQGWFAVGFVVRNFSAGQSLIFSGRNSPNIPYLQVTYQPVPVELTSFTAEVMGNNVTLNWQTATEKNNRGFEVERQSLDLNQSINQSTNQWSAIGFVEGNGTSTEEHSYSFTDLPAGKAGKNVTAGKYSYRLKQIDFDGTYKYSNTVDVEKQNFASLQFYLNQNYPNPFNPTTTIKYSIPVAGLVTIKVYDLLGQEVAVLVNENKQAGTYDLEFNASSLSTGVYIYKLTAGSFTGTKKLLLLK